MVEEVHSLPSPQSESGYDASPEINSRAFSMTPATEAQPEPSSADESSVMGGSTGQRAINPPRNAAGKIICQHPNATSTCSSLTFDRKCEWSKHMDKHERPYICDEPGCEKLQGFTYSGGLLRHKREVHKKHGGPKETLMCPYPYCKRSTGHGFTRKENLNEHIRRVHRPVPEPSSTTVDVTRGDGEDKAAASVYTGPLPYELNVTPASSRRSRKRKAPDSPAPTESPAIDASSEQAELREEIKRLRRDAELKDIRIQKLESHLNLFLLRQHQTEKQQQLEPEEQQPQPQQQQQQQEEQSSKPQDTKAAPQISSDA